MNYLSTKLAKALRAPALPSYRKSSNLTPSSASIIVPDGLGGKKVVGACLRQQYYKITDVEESSSTINVDWTLSAIMGDSMHKMMDHLIDTHGFAMGIQKITSEHPIYDKAIKLSGRSDLIAWDYNNKEPVGIEVKSIGEYKAKKALEQPLEEHVLQSVVYLDFYNRNIKDNQKKIKKWYLWYVSRTENWSVKSKPHNSEFTMLWDYCIELDDKIPIIKGSNFTQRWEHYSVDAIYERYKSLTDYVATNTLPPRDYDLKYSEEKIAGLYKLNAIAKKADQEAIEKWLKKGAPPGKLKVEMGDGECMFCSYADLCWNGTQNKEQKKFSNLPKVEEKKSSPPIDFV